MSLPKLVLVCGLVAALATPAYAGGVRPSKADPDAFQLTVDYSDLDLERAAGADMLLGRLRQAARAVCGEPSDPRDFLGKARARRACVSVATEDAVSRIASPLVTARYARSKSAAMLAERWQCSEQHIRNMIDRGKIPSFKIGDKLLRIRREHVEAFECQNGDLPDSEANSVSPGKTSADSADVIDLEQRTPKRRHAAPRLDTRNSRARPARM